MSLGCLILIPAQKSFTTSLWNMNKTFDLEEDKPPDIGENNFLQNFLFLFFYSVAGFLALTGNLLVIKIVLNNKRLQTFVHVLLANMAFSDFLCAATFFTGLFTCSDFLITVTGTNIPCLANKAVWLLCFQVSSVTMLFVAVDRWIAVFFPFYHRTRYSENSNKRTGITLLCLWITASLLIILTSPSLAYQRYFLKNALIKCELAKAFDIFRLDDERSQRILLVVANLAHFWIPFLIISLAYGSIVVKVWRRKLSDTTSIGQEDVILLQKWKTIKMLIAAVAVFMICWLPFFIVNIVYFAKGSQQKRPCTESLPFLFVMWMAFSSCCYNPIVYWIYNDSYRGGLWDIFSAIGGKRLSGWIRRLSQNPHA